jgi:hypothetical protein
VPPPDFPLAGQQARAKERAKRPVGDRLGVIALVRHEHVFGMFGLAQQQYRSVAAERDAHRVAVHALQLDVRRERVAGHAGPPPQRVTTTRSGNFRDFHDFGLHSQSPHRRDTQ